MLLDVRVMFSCLSPSMPSGTIPVRIAEVTADLLRYEIHAKKVTHEIKRRRNEAILALRC